MLRQHLAALGFIIAKLVACSLPERLRYPVARWVGRTTCRLLPKRRRIIQDNLRPLVGDDPAVLERKTSQLFENFALTLCDFLNPKNVKYEIENQENLEILKKFPEGTLFITFHLGHWELGAKILCELGWKLTAIYQPYVSGFLQSVIQRLRYRPIRYVPVGQGAAGGTLKALAKGEGVAMIGDQAFGEPGLPIDLDDNKILWPRGPYLLAARTGAWVVPGIVIRTAPGRYKAFVEKPIRFNHGSVKEADDLAKQTAELYVCYLRRYPEQWYRFEPFWIGRSPGRSSVGRAHGSGP